MRVSKKFLIACATVAFPLAAIAEDLATIMGNPSETEFVNRILKRRIPVQPAEASSDNGSRLATAIYSVLSRREVPSVAAFEVWGRNGNISMPSLSKAFQMAASDRIPVVLSIFGAGNNDPLCKQMAAYPDTAFVTVAGASGTMRDPNLEPNCGAANILMATAYDQTRSRPLPHYNYGGFIRIAGPGVKIPVTRADGTPALMSNQSVAAALVAARLAVFASQHPNERGAKLVEHFLSEETRQIPALEGRVQNALALDDMGF